MNELDKVVPMSGVTRVEVIDQAGRSYVQWGLGSVSYSLQDQGSTLKIFADPADSVSNATTDVAEANTPVQREHLEEVVKHLLRVYVVDDDEWDIAQRVNELFDQMIKQIQESRS